MCFTVWRRLTLNVKRGLPGWAGPSLKQRGLVSIGEGLSSPESGHLTLKHPSLSGLSEDITAAIVLLKCAEGKLFSLVPREEFAAT
jgi:hypothetical protein